MTVWCHLPTIFKPRLTLRTAGFIALCVALTTTLIFAHASQAAPGINATLNFQARLQTAGGAVVPDGHYNIQFKIYQDGSGTDPGNPDGDLMWTETYINNGGTNGVQVKNGYMSVSLGERNPFGNQVDWNQDTLWLSMNIAGSATNCTTFNTGSCASDGEMTPMKRLTATPYAINSGQLGGKTADNFIQLAQGVQDEVGTGTSSIHINKTQTNGNFLTLQNAGADALKIDHSGNIEFGNNQATHYIGVQQAGSNADGGDMGVIAGAGGSGSGNYGGTLILQGGAAGGTNGIGGNVWIDAGAGTGTGDDGEIAIGAARARSVVIGNIHGTNTQEILIGANNAGGTSNVTIGASGTATAGSTSIQSKDDTTVSTNGTQRARFSGNGNTLYLGNADNNGQATTANSFAIQGTSSTGSNVQGGSLSVQAGSATAGNANGGDLTLGGGAGAGTGSEGLIVLSSPTAFQAASVQSCASNCAITQANVDSNGVVIVNATASGVTFTLNTPTNTTAGRIVYVMAANGSNDFTLSVNGGGVGNLTSMRQNTTATMIWSGGGGGYWTVAGASNSTTLQSAYDNTLQSAGGAELIVSSGTNANGLTIRDSSTNPVNGTLLEVQNASASTLFSVNSNVPEYATNGGAETAGSPFPANTWSDYGNASTVSRHTNMTDGYVATGQASAKVEVTGFLSGIKNQLSTALKPNTKYNVSFGARLESGVVDDLTIAYATDGSSASATCAWGEATLIKSAWKKVNCSFTTPTGTLSSANSIIIAQVSGGSRTYYVDNLSVTIAGDQNYATDGTVNTQTSFDNGSWSATSGASVARITNDGQEKSDSAQVTTTSGGTNRGIRNLLAKKPLPDTLYRVSVNVKSSNSFSDFSVRYTLDGATFTECVDYNNSLPAFASTPQSVSTTEWTEITCYIRTPASDSGTAAIHLVQAASAARVFKVDAFEMTLATNTAANVQIGGGAKGGQTTLFTLDQGGSAPIAENNDALLGSMYYDTTLGKIQCYEADGWGACGSSPDNIITISPEYTNAVMNGTGIGTMTSDFCSNTASLTINTSICSSGQTQNFYKWTSPQNDSQTYGIFVTYQLPGTFKSFASGQTTLQGRTDNGSNGGAASVKYTVMKKSGTTLETCGSQVTVSENTQTNWLTGTATGTADPSTCGFAPGDSIVFKIDVTANKNAKAYVSDLGFTFSNN